ncbi:MAG: DUF6748 domain-containing protein [Myxococcota bacterium]
MKRTSAILRFAAISLAIIPFIGCSDDAGVGANEEPAGLSGEKADGVDYDNWTYFMVTRQDMRRCVSPVCGGVYVKRVGQPQVKCADGKWAKECYVGGFDFAALGYSSDEASDAMGAIVSQKAIFRGQMVTKYFGGDFNDIPAFAATEVWVAATDKKPTSVFFRAQDLGIVCITAPCLSIEGVKLNKNANPSARYAGLDLTALKLDEVETQVVWSALRENGLVVAGKAVDTTGPGGKAQTLKASQVYLKKLAAPVAEGQACGGRNPNPCPEGSYCQYGTELCGKADGGGTCQPMPAACGDDDAAVCGCDGVTYANDCERQRAGAGFGTPGECKSDAACKIAGCSGELCLPADSEQGISMCMWRDEYACYQQLGVCETQGDGSCGWTATDELTSCLANAGAQ